MQKILFTSFFLFYCAVAVYINVSLQTYHNDAISRTALGFFTVYGRDPHLAAVGFVWQPLPSLLQVPLIIALKPFGLLLLAGPIVTAVFGAISCLYIYKIALHILGSLYKRTVLLITVLFGLNPMILLYSTIGTSEIIFFASIIATIYYLLRWKYNNQPHYLLTASFFVSLSFWSRYESLPAFVGFGGLLIAHFLFRKISFKEFESNALLFAIPFIYTVFFWILINWLIMGNPFYFMDSPYSNASFTADFQGQQRNIFIVLFESVQYVLERVMFLTPILIILPLEVIFVIPALETKKERISEYMLLAFLTLPGLSVLAFHVYQLYKGESFGWLRFYMYSIVVAFLFAIYLIRKKSRAIQWLVIALLCIGSLTTAVAMSDPSLGREEYSFVRKILNPSTQLDFSRSYLDQKHVAAEIDNLTGTVLVDTDKGFAIPLFSKNAERFVITSDEDYLEVVKNYPKYVDWIIIPQPANDDRGQNKIYTYYPGIWDGNAPSLELHTDLTNWRIFKVIKPTSVSTN